MEPWCCLPALFAIPSLDGSCQACSSVHFAQLRLGSLLSGVRDPVLRDDSVMATGWRLLLTYQNVDPPRGGGGGGHNAPEVAALLLAGELVLEVYARGTRLNHCLHCGWRPMRINKSRARGKTAAAMVGSLLLQVGAGSSQPQAAQVNQCVRQHLGSRTAMLLYMAEQISGCRAWPQQTYWCKWDAAVA